jgi:hypothetical protein
LQLQRRDRVESLRRSGKRHYEKKNTLCDAATSAAATAAGISRSTDMKKDAEDPLPLWQKHPVERKTRLAGVQLRNGASDSKAASLRAVCLNE